MSLPSGSDANSRLEFLDPIFVKGDSRAPGKEIICEVCPPERSRRAVTVCGWTAESTNRTGKIPRGCSKPICIEHTGICHDAGFISGLNSEPIAVLQKGRQAFSFNLERWEACCCDCKSWLASSKAARLERPNALFYLVTISAFLVFLAIFSIVVGANLLKQNVISQAQRCDFGWTYHEPLDLCVIQFKTTREAYTASIHDPNWYKWYEFRGVITCLDYGFKRCRCNQFFMKNEPFCDEPWTCNPNTEYLEGRVCVPNGIARKQKSKGKCRYYRKYNEVLGICQFQSCPHSYRRTYDGGCEQCWPYTGWKEDCSTVYFWQRYDEEEYQYYQTPWARTRNCAFENGATVEFFDALGQLQCPNATTRDKYDSSLPPEQRLCKPHEIMMKNIIGCYHECPPYEAYSFIHRRCMRRSCKAFQTLMRNGDCFTCYPWLHEACPMEQP